MCQIRGRWVHVNMQSEIKHFSLKCLKIFNHFNHRADSTGVRILSAQTEQFNHWENYKSLNFWAADWTKKTTTKKQGKRLNIQMPLFIRLIKRQLMLMCRMRISVLETSPIYLQAKTMKYIEPQTFFSLLVNTTEPQVENIHQGSVLILLFRCMIITCHHNKEIHRRSAETWINLRSFHFLDILCNGHAVASRYSNWLVAQRGRGISNTIRNMIDSCLIVGGARAPVSPRLRKTPFWSDSVT